MIDHYFDVFTDPICYCLEEKVGTTRKERIANLRSALIEALSLNIHVFDCIVTEGDSKVKHMMLGLMNEFSSRDPPDNFTDSWTRVTAVFKCTTPMAYHRIADAFCCSRSLLIESTMNSGILYGPLLNSTPPMAPPPGKIASVLL